MANQLAMNERHDDAHGRFEERYYCSLEFPSSVDHVVASYRAANRRWIEIVERQNEVPPTGLMVLTHAMVNIEFEREGEQIVRLPYVICFDDLSDLRAFFVDPQDAEMPKMEGLANLVGNVNFQFDRLDDESFDKDKEQGQRVQPAAETDRVSSTVHIDQARRTALAKQIGLIAWVKLGLIGIPFALSLGLYLTRPVGEGKSLQIGWRRLLLIGACFACLKPIVNWLIASAVSTFWVPDSIGSVAISIALNLASGFGMLVGISFLVCKAHLTRLTNAVLVAMILLVASELVTVLKLFLSRAT